MAKVPLFAAGGGKMGALLREYDWSRTPLGPIESWPQSLRTTVGWSFSPRCRSFFCGAKTAS